MITFKRQAVLSCEQSISTTKSLLPWTPKQRNYERPLSLFTTSTFVDYFVSQSPTISVPDTSQFLCCGLLHRLRGRLRRSGNDNRPGLAGARPSLLHPAHSRHAAPAAAAGSASGQDAALAAGVEAGTSAETALVRAASHAVDDLHVSRGCRGENDEGEQSEKEERASHFGGWCDAKLRWLQVR